MPGMLYFLSTIGMLFFVSYAYRLDDDSKLRDSALALFSLTFLLSLFALFRAMFPSYFHVLNTAYMVTTLFTGFAWFFFTSRFVNLNLSDKSYLSIFCIYTIFAIMAVTEPLHGLYATYKPIKY